MFYISQEDGNLASEMLRDICNQFGKKKKSRFFVGYLSLKDERRSYTVIMIISWDQNLFNCLYVSDHF